jgi:hypothetical protein
MTLHLAEMNIAGFRTPVNDPVNADFVNATAQRAMLQLFVFEEHPDTGQINCRVANAHVPPVDHRANGAVFDENILRVKIAVDRAGAIRRGLIQLGLPDRLAGTFEVASISYLHTRDTR